VTPVRRFRPFAWHDLSAQVDPFPDIGPVYEIESLATPVSNNREPGVTLHR